MAFSNELIRIYNKGGSLPLARTWLLAALSFLSCTQNFSATHKLYSAPTSANQSIGFVPLGESFMLTRADFFSNALSIPNDSIYNKLENLSDSIIFNQISKKYNTVQIPKNTREKFSKETQKLDKTIFIKTVFPEQGVEITDTNGSVPDYLFIIHEFTIGGDLDPINFYDYTKANVELNQKKKFKNLSIIVSFSLWDNKKQIPLKSGISDSQTPLKNNFIDRDIFTNAIKNAVEKCLEK
ncbi:hypothetical protein AGMMS49938_10090 [Fibrobacterales bacterium]|nr:hypothetical protein AGMMS49938_10090 [Fibrobacterales bacterium]